MKTFVKECRWGTFLLLHKDMLSTYANIYGEWSEMEVRLFKSLLTSESNVIEVGANLGLHTVPLAKFAPGGSIICFEPQRIVYQVLCANAVLNNLTNVFAFHAAVSDQNRSITIETSNYDKLWNYASFSLDKGMSTEGAFRGKVSHEAVQAVALDTVEAVSGLSALDLLKIDAEGHELQVLRGAAQTIARLQPIIFIENNNEDHGDQIISHIKQLGYTSYWFCSARYQPDNFNGLALQVPQDDVNMVCFPKSRAPFPGLNPVERFADIADGLVRQIHLPDPGA